MNRKLFGLAVSCFTFVSIIGTGFAQWQFQESYNSELVVNDVLGDATIDNIETSISIGSVTSTNFSYTLGQGDKAEDFSDETKGIVITSQPIITLQLSDEFISSYELSGVKKVSEINFTYEVEISSTGGLSSYLELNGGTTGSFKCDTAGKATHSLNLSLKYKAYKKPLDNKDYQKMIEAKQEKDIALKITINANIN